MMVAPRVVGDGVEGARIGAGRLASGGQFPDQGDQEREEQDARDVDRAFGDGAERGFRSL